MNPPTRKGTLMVFARAPLPGKTKTRLIPALGADGAARLHAELVHRTLARVTAAEGANVELWCAPSADDPFLQSCAAKHGIPLHTQRGDDLGARMAHAFDTALRTAPWAILVGTDIPELGTGDVQQAVGYLRGGMDAVIGPAFDGGYYLLGLRKTSPELFRQIPWGTEQVWPDTRDRLVSLGWSWATTARHRDVDRPEDLVHIPDFLQSALGLSVKTASLPCNRSKA